MQNKGISALQQFRTGSLVQALICFLYSWLRILQGCPC